MTWNDDPWGEIEPQPIAAVLPPAHEQPTRTPTPAEQRVADLEGVVLVWVGGMPSTRCDLCGRTIGIGERYEIGWKNRDYLIEDFTTYHADPCPEADVILFPTPKVDR